MLGLSLEFSDSGKPSSFSHTCTLLSRYLKEKGKGKLGDLRLGTSFHEKGVPMATAPSATTGNVDTMNLFPTLVPSYGNFTGISRTQTTPLTSRDVASMDLFPQHSGFGPSGSKGDVPSEVDHSVNKPVPETKEMTIFYGGRVFVFNDVSAEKAKEITTFANKASNHVSSTFASRPTQRPRETPNAIGSNLANNMPVARISSSIASDVPIARKASLTRFLEKRKNRVLTRAPYEKSYSSASFPKENNKSWLGLAP